MQRVTAEFVHSRVFSKVLTELLVENCLLTRLAVFAPILSRNILHLSPISLSWNTTFNAGFAQVEQNQ